MQTLELPPAAQRSDGSAVAPSSFFEPLAPRAGCPFCATGGKRPSAAPVVDAIYCISVREEEDRTRQAADHFHAIGLCSQVVFYRPPRGRSPAAITLAIATSHRDVARHAIAQGHDKVLVLEDDVHFDRPWDEVCRRLARAIPRLPAGWMALFLGHLPIQAYFVARDVLRTRSVCCHAYIAHRRLLDWLANAIVFDATIPMWRWGIGIDLAFTCLPEMYALFPMVATQRELGVRRLDRQIASTTLFMRAMTAIEYWSIYRGLRLYQAIAVLLSPLHWLSMRLRRIGSGQSGRVETRLSRQAKLIRGAGLFDDDFYLASQPDVAGSLMNPLAHYIWHGDQEGRPPHPLFDVGHYRRAVGPELKASTNSVLHYLQSDALLRKDPHPLFDGAWYLARYPDVAAMGANPLVHYVTQGWREGRMPSRSFDSARYLKENPDVAGQDPLAHYVRQGRQQGRAPWFDPGVAFS